MNPDKAWNELMWAVNGFHLRADLDGPDRAVAYLRAALRDYDASREEQP